jgi:hypothetical protein
VYTRMIAPVFICFSLGLGACSKDDIGDSGETVVDLDSDGVVEGEDCDDLDAALGSQLEDADCDGTLSLDDCDDTDPALNEADVDADGASTCAGDCDDEDSAVYPAATEVCNGVDDDCDGLLDSDDDSVDMTNVPDWYRDADQDGFGDEEDSLTQCDQPAWYVLEQSEGFDCDDSDPDAYPGATEYCDGHDDNCDGEIDEDSAADVLTWYADSDNDGFGYLTNTDIDCYQPSGYVADSTDCNDGNDNAYPGNDEICDGVDNDCLGDVDEDDALDVLTWYADTDTDGFGDPVVTDIDCYQPTGYVADNTDCDDTEITTYPGADEYCDGVNNDCDNDTDEDHALDAPTWYADTDTDGFGDPAITDIECYQPSGYVADNTDCDDGEITTYPGADEYCDGVNNDCDSETDEDDALDVLTWYADTDTDGFGDAAVSDIDCYQPTGYVADNTDCDDGEVTTYPGADEYCDGVNNDCDSETDEDHALDATTWYADTDTDGFGDPAITDIECYQPSGYVADNTDCDDGEITTYPGADEYCDGVNNDCDSETDEDHALDATTWYADSDTDGFGDAAVTDVECYQPSGYVADNTDCDDGEITTYPGADEYCDGVNNDCDSETDEDDALDVLTWYADTDTDGYGDPAVTDIDCYQPTGYVADNTDCDDSDSTLDPSDDDLDGYSTCDGDCDDTDSTLNLDDSDSDGLSTCDGDCDDSDASLSNQDYTLDASTDTWTNTSLSYCDVVLKNGATLYVSGVVDLSAFGTFSMDATSEINGDGAGEAAASGSGSGGYSSSGGGGGAGYGGAGGLGGYDSSDTPGSGGSAYGSSTSESISMGSGGGNSDRAGGGAGGAAIAIWSDSIAISGTISMNGVAGEGSSRSGGGGSGGGILLVGNTVSISGDLDALGGNGGSGSSSANDGGGGGGGGRVKVFYDSSLSYPGGYDVSGGSGGTYGSASHGANGVAGTETETSQAYP